MILVTGGAGLLGSELIQQLIAGGEKVKAIYHNTAIPVSSSSLLQTVHCDILDVNALEDVMHDVDHVYHCAGYVSYAPGASEKLYKINVEGTANVMNAALDAGVLKVVHVSSVASLGRTDTKHAVTEHHHWSSADEKSRYAYSKYLGEMEVWRAVAEGLNAVIVNPSVILGAGNWNEGSTAIFKSVYNEFPWYADGVAGFADVKDVAALMIMLMKSDIHAERFIINAHNASFENILNLIADGFHKKRPSKKVTPFLASVVWRMEKIKSAFTKKEPLITKETAESALQKVYYDNSKLLKVFPDFNYRPLEETIAYCCKVLQQKVNKP